jgi:hypothetical protein
MSQDVPKCPIWTFILCPGLVVSFEALQHSSSKSCISFGTWSLSPGEYLIFIIIYHNIYNLLISIIQVAECSMTHFMCCLSLTRVSPKIQRSSRTWPLQVFAESSLVSREPGPRSNQRAWLLELNAIQCRYIRHIGNDCRLRVKSLAVTRGSLELRSTILVQSIIKQLASSQGFAGCIWVQCLMAFEEFGGLW